MQFQKKNGDIMKRINITKEKLDKHEETKSIGNKAPSIRSDVQSIVTYS